MPAAFAAAATTLVTRAGLAQRRLRVVAAVLVVLLRLGAAGFVVPNALLGLLLVVSLPVLLFWVGATAYRVGRYGPC